MQEPLFKDQNLLARLDRIPLTRTSSGIIVLLSFVWLAEAFDIGIVGPVITVLKGTWHLTSTQMALLGVTSTAGVVLGLFPAGIIADKFGRRPVVIVGIAWFSVLTLLGAFFNSFWPICLIRFLAGIGEGAVIPLPYLYISEFVHTKRRAVNVGYSNGVLTAAYLVPNLAAVWALGTFGASVAWRIPFLLGGIPLFLTIPLILWLPESPRFLLKTGRREIVRRLVEKLEGQAGLPHDETLVNHHSLAVIQKGLNERPRFTTLLKAPYINRTLLVALQLTGALILFYILLVFGPTLLAARGIGSKNAILFTGMMMAIAGIGSIVQGYLSDAFGRKRILATYFICAAIGCGIFGITHEPFWALTAGFLTSFFGLGVFPVSKLAIAEQYPTRLRGKGVYISEMGARTLSGVITLYFIPFLLDRWGNQFIFDGMVVALLLCSLPFVVWGRETAIVSIEEAGTDLSFGAPANGLMSKDISATNKA